MKKTLIATCALLVCGSAIADTFYLQAAKDKADRESWEDPWWDDPVAGNHMTNVVGAAFAGNRFELNGFRYDSWSGTSTLDSKRKFGGTLVKKDEKIMDFTENWVVEGLHVTTESVTSNNGLLVRRADSNVTVTDLQLDGLLVVRDNNDGYGLDMNVASLNGAGTLGFGRDDDELNNVWGLDVDNAAFTGTIELNTGILQFNDDLLLSSATLSVESNAFNSVVLLNNASFAAMDLGGDALETGTYTAAQLETRFGTTGTFSGSGSLTVIPEPATLGLITAFGGSILFIRRRFMI